MLPTLGGRIQSRIFFLATIGAFWSRFDHRPRCCLRHRRRRRSGRPATRTPSSCSLPSRARRRCGSCVYHFLMQWRWEKDWPTFFGLMTFLNEGILVYLLARPRLRGAIARHRRRPVPFWFFWLAFLVVWMAVWIWWRTGRCGCRSTSTGGSSAGGSCERSTPGLHPVTGRRRPGPARRARSCSARPTMSRARRRRRARPRTRTSLTPEGTARRWPTGSPRCWPMPPRSSVGRVRPGRRLGHASRSSVMRGPTSRPSTASSGWRCGNPVTECAASCPERCSRSGPGSARSMSTRSRSSWGNLEHGSVHAGGLLLRRRATGGAWRAAAPSLAAGAARPESTAELPRDRRRGHRATAGPRAGRAATGAQSETAPRRASLPTAGPAARRRRTTAAGSPATRRTHRRADLPAAAPRRAEPVDRSQPFSVGGARSMRPGPRRSRRSARHCRSSPGAPRAGGTRGRARPRTPRARPQRPGPRRLLQERALRRPGRAVLRDLRHLDGPADPGTPARAAAPARRARPRRRKHLQPRHRLRDRPRPRPRSSGSPTARPGRCASTTAKG